MSRNTNRLIIAGSAACLIATAGEFAMLFWVGSSTPHYNQLTDTMSNLGATSSLSSKIISAWWCIAGVLFTIFGYSIKIGYSKHAKNSMAAAWLIILYGIGEGIGSGVFKADHQSYIGIIHNAVGGIGVISIMLLPLCMPKLINTIQFERYSNIVFILNIIFIALFLFRYIPNALQWISTYKGIWQRLFMLNSYVYLSIIAYLNFVNFRSKKYT